jgi:hypothetical protein
MVGWYNGVGYHADDANIFKGTKGKVYKSRHGPTERTYGQSQKPETIGCGVDLQSGMVFFTLNGEYLGKAAKIDVSTSRWFPAISFRCESRVVVNFGQSPFYFKRANEDIATLEMETR